MFPLEMTTIPDAEKLLASPRWLKPSNMMSIMLWCRIEHSPSVRPARELLLHRLGEEAGPEDSPQSQACREGHTCEQ